MSTAAKKIAFFAVAIVAVLSSGCATPDRTPLDTILKNTEPNRWVLLHRQSEGDEVRFTRQRHGGSAFDCRRGRLILFGSDTHDKLPDPAPKTPDGVDWKNNPFFFDMKSLTWSTPYPEDDWTTYRANDDGLPVAGPDGRNPWAMHTFGALVYDTARDEMVVCSWPAHMRPGRFTDVLEPVWNDVQRHPTWIYSLATEVWRPLDGKPMHFFPYAAAYDSDRGVVIGYGGPGIWELRGEPRAWHRVDGKALFGWHNNAVYDSRHKALVVFGSNQNANDIVVYRPATGEHAMMPTPGLRPPKDQHAPMSFDPTVGRTVVVVDPRTPDDKGARRTGVAETWLYDMGADAWTPLPDATLPFPMGMNYNLEYDPVHRLNVLVADMPDESGQVETAVFALVIDLRKLARQIRE